MSGLLVKTNETLKFIFFSTNNTPIKVQLLEFIKTARADSEALHGGHGGSGIIES